MRQDDRTKRTFDLLYSGSFLNALYISSPRSDLSPTRNDEVYQFRMLALPIRITVHFAIQMESFVVSTSGAKGRGLMEARILKSVVNSPDHIL